MARDSVAKIKIKSEADLTGINQFNQSVKNMNRTLSGANFVLRTFGVTFAAALVGKAITSAIQSQVELSKSMARVRFSLNQVGGDMQKNISVVRGFGTEMQKAGLASRNLASEIGAKSLKAFRDQNKAFAVSRSLLIGQRIGILDANDAINAMIDAQNGNNQALRNLLVSMGLAAPEFASFESLVANLTGGLNASEGALSSFGRQWTRLTGLLRSGAERAGDVLATAFLPVLEGINAVLEDPKKAFRTFVRSFDGFWKDVGKIFTGRSAEVGNIWVFFLQGLFETMVSIGRTTLNVWMALMTGIASVTKSGSGLVLKVWRAWIGGLGEALFLWFSLVQSRLSIFWSEIRLLFIRGRRVVQPIWASMIDSLGEKLFTASQFILTKWRNFWKQIATIVAIGKSLVLGFVETLVNKVKEQVQKILDFIQSARDAAAVPITIIRNVVTRFTSAIARVFRQTGGAIAANTSALVGERGPEVFTPSRGGTITPNNQLGGGGTTINISVTGNTFVGDDRETANRIGDQIIKRLEMVHRFGLSI